MKKHKRLLLDGHNGTVYMKIKKRVKKCVQLFNIFPYTYSNNSQRGRIYSSVGLSPAIGTFQGGGLEPKIIKVNGLWL